MRACERRLRRPLAKAFSHIPKICFLEVHFEGDEERKFLLHFQKVWDQNKKGNLFSSRLFFQLDVERAKTTEPKQSLSFEIEPRANQKEIVNWPGQCMPSLTFS